MQTNIFRLSIASFMSNPNRAALTEKHSFFNDTKFRLKISLLTAKRYFNNLRHPVHQFKDEGRLLDYPIIAFSESALWNPFDNADNWILTAGKIQNLRLAVKQINGIEVKANEIFSFWAHIGNPNFGKGYVVGREIREGCIVPTIAGGLCQVSNALYDAALKANFDIVERHRHTKVIQGSLAEQGRDATVKWNYVDLRFKSAFDFRIEAELSATHLIIVFRSTQRNVTNDGLPPIRQSVNQLNDCYSCGNMACFKHPNKTTLKQDAAKTSFILDDRWPEFEAYIKQQALPNDEYIVPLRQNAFIKTPRYNWSIEHANKIKTTTYAGLYRALMMRLRHKGQNNVFELGLQLDKRIALSAAKLIPIECTHLVIAQNLLPFLLESGCLGGRTYDVLMTRLPFEKLHQQLDAAYEQYSDSPTLKDFRASQAIIHLENKGLTQARKIITPHRGIAALFQNKVTLLDWAIPSLPEASNHKGNKILFPASLLGRKGAYEIKRLAQEFNLQLVVTGSALEYPTFSDGLNLEPFNGNFNQIGLVIYPAYTEHQPRLVLKALARGIPVIASSACGLAASPLVSLISAGDYPALKAAFETYAAQGQVLLSQ